ncbi:hypothetical protein BC940DRAFT_297395 [Gongronella butleri]|nr:hypothetical protein BC940DRAFT_297395 [Gongronella butleri]
MSEASRCPLCSQSVHVYQIHFDTTIRMCENVQCDYPFNQLDPAKFISKTGSTLRKKPPGSMAKKAPVPRPAEPTRKVGGLALPMQCSSKGTMMMAPAQVSMPVAKKLRPMPPMVSRVPACQAMEMSPAPVNNSNYTLSDIEGLLNDDDTSTVVVTPKDDDDLNHTILDSMHWLDALCDKTLPSESFLQSPLYN